MVLDNLLSTVASMAAGATGSIAGMVQTTFFLLIAIDFVAAILLNLGDTDHIKQLISKILRYGFWMWIIGNWGMLLNAVTNSLSAAGATMGGLDFGALQHPSQILDAGLQQAEPFYNYITSDQFTSMTGFFGSIGLWLMACFGGFAIWLAFAVLALQCFITYVEFYIASALVLVFIPFGVSKHTSFMAEKAIGAVISFGTKLMVLSAILGLSYPLIKASMYSFNGNPTWDGILGAIVGPWALTFLGWQAPAMAAGIMTGAPSLSAGTVAGAAMAGAAGGSAGVTAATGMAGSAGAAASAGFKGGSAVYGAAVGGTQKAAATSDLGAAAGAMKGMASFAGAKAKGMYQGATQGMRDSFSSAKETASGGSTSSGSGGSEASGGSGSAGGSAGGGGSANFKEGRTDSRSSSAGASDSTGGSSTGDNTVHGDGFTMSGGYSGASGGFKNTGFGSSGGHSSANGSAKQDNSKSSFKSGPAASAGSTGSSATSGGDNNRFKQFMAEAQRAIPPEGAPEGGMNAPIRNDD